MPLRFTDQHAMSLVLPHLFPGEQALYRARAVEKPWYARVFSKMGSIFWRYYLVVATNQRLLFVQHKGLLGGYGGKNVQSFSWDEIDSVKLGWGIFEKSLRIRAPGRRVTKNVMLGRFWMRGNFDAARGIVGAWETGRAALGAPVAPPALAGW